MKTSILVGASLDGFIARPDGGLDFLHSGDNEPLIALRHVASACTAAASSRASMLSPYERSPDFFTHCPCNHTVVPTGMARYPALIFPIDLRNRAGPAV